MAITERRPLEDLYPPEHSRRPHRRGVIDDTLDVYPPYHLFEGPPTPGEIEAATRLAAERGYRRPSTGAPASPSPNGVHTTARRTPAKRAAEAGGKAKKK